MTDAMEKPEIPAKKKHWLAILFSSGVIVVLAFVALGVFSVAGWEYSNSNNFCATACHNVHPEEPYAHQLSHHANVACVECHIGRVSTFKAIGLKSGHITHAWSLLVGYERPRYSKSMSDALNSCEGCHTKEPHRHNVVITKKKFAADRRNSERKLTLSMRLNGRDFAEEIRRGVNWHASGAIRFIATDPQNLDIRWIEVTDQDGTKNTYSNVVDPLTSDEIEAADKQVMDCIDCHNRAGHPFTNPEEAIDAALADGSLSPDLPYIKERLVELLSQEFETEEQAEELTAAAWRQYNEDYPDLKEKNPEEWEAARRFLEERHNFMANLMVRARFADEGVSWRSFPDHNGHKFDPGCFRCHSGRLQTESGTPITMNCTNCHSIPLVMRRDRVPDYFLSLLDKEKPQSHRDPAFISRHMDLAGEECTECHDQLRFGVNDRSYCSNSGCHDESWQHLDLDAVRATRPTEDAGQTSGGH